MKIGELAQRTNNRKAKEDVLKASEQRFRDLVNTTDGIVWEADARTFQFTFISEKAVKLLGFPAADWLEPGFWISRLHPEDATWAPEFCASCTGRLEPHDFNYRFIAQDGRTVWLHDIVTVVAEQGAPRWLRGIMVDVTAHKQAEIAIQTSRDRLNAVLQTTIDGYWLVDLKGRIIDVNDAAAKMLGYTREALLQLGPNDIDASVPPDDVHARIKRMLKSGGERFETKHRTRSGEIIDVEVTITMLPDHSALVVFVRDITERKHAADELARERLFLAALLNNIAEAVVSCDAKGVLTRFNESARSLLGLPEQSVAPEKWPDYFGLYRSDGVSPMPKEAIPLFRAMQGERVLQAEMAVIPKGGKARFLVASSQPMHDAGGQLLGAVATMHDITERKEAEGRLRESERRFRDIADVSADWIWEVDLRGRYTYASESVRSLLGYSPEEIIGKTPFDLMTPAEGTRVAASFAAIVQRAVSFRDLENKVIDASGRTHDTLTSGVPIRDESGACIGYRGVDRDISERKRLEAELTRRAHVDYLTGLNNRGYFIERAEEEFRRAIRYGKMLSVGMMDIDNFKKINDEYGHKTGDAALKVLAEVCSQTLREVDIVGRMGGEEFAILMPETHSEAALDVAERLRVALASAEVPREFGAPSIRFTVSIGLATKSSADESLEFLLNLADQALYRAKGSGKNRVCMTGDVTAFKEP